MTNLFTCLCFAVTAQVHFKKKLLFQYTVQKKTKLRLFSFACLVCGPWEPSVKTFSFRTFCQILELNTALSVVTSCCKKYFLDCGSNPQPSLVYSHILYS